MIKKTLVVASSEDNGGSLIADEALSNTSGVERAREEHGRSARLVVVGRLDGLGADHLHSERVT